MSYNVSCEKTVFSLSVLRILLKNLNLSCEITQNPYDFNGVDVRKHIFFLSFFGPHSAHWWGPIGVKKFAVFAWNMQAKSYKFSVSNDSFGLFVKDRTLRFWSKYLSQWYWNSKWFWIYLLLALVSAVRSLGLDVLELPPDESNPQSIFTQDLAVSILLDGAHWAKIGLLSSIMIHVMFWNS